MALRLGILGAGRIGRIHLANAMRHSFIEVVAVCEPNPGQDLREALKLTLLHTDEEVFWREEFDAVIIASPSDRHADHAKRAIALGKHVFCEKPLHQSIGAHREIKELLKGSGLVFQIGFNRRFDRDFSAIAKGMAEGSLGKPYYLRITSRDPRPPTLSYVQSSGGMFFDMSIHDFDMARFLMAAEVSEVFAMGAALVNQEFESIPDIDTAIITLKFDNGAMGIIDNCRQAVYGYDQRVEIFGSFGSLNNENIRKSALSLSDSKGMHHEALLDFFIDRYADSYRHELTTFVDSCLFNKPVQVSIDDALMAVAIAHAASQSLKKQVPVKVAGLI